MLHTEEYCAAKVVVGFDWTGVIFIVLFIRNICI